MQLVGRAISDFLQRMLWLMHGLPRQKLIGTPRSSEWPERASFVSISHVSRSAKEVTTVTFPMPFNYEIKEIGIEDIAPRRQRYCSGLWKKKNIFFSLSFMALVISDYVSFWFFIFYLCVLLCLSVRIIVKLKINGQMDNPYLSHIYQIVIIENCKN